MYRDLNRRRQHHRRRDLLLSLPFVDTGDRRSNDRFNWPVDRLSDHLVFDWADGDGLTPDTGPVLFTSGNVITGGIAPFVSHSGARMSSTFFQNGQLTTNPVNEISAGQDTVLVCLVNPVDMLGGLSNYLFVMYSQSNGFTANPTYSLFTTSGTLYFGIFGTPGSIYPLISGLGPGWLLVIAVLDRDGNSFHYTNRVQSSTPATPSLLNASDIIFFLGAASAGARWSQNSRTMVYQGVGIADLITADYVKELTSSVLGIGPATGEQPTFARSSMATKISGSKLFFFGKYAPCAGDENGILLEPGVTNKVYRNYNPAATSGLTVTGGMTLAVVADDSTDLADATDDLSDLGPAVFRVANSTGSTQYVYATPVTGNVNTHSLSVYARYISGSGVELGLYDQNAGTFSNGVTISDNYARTEQENQTPPDTDCSWCLEIPDGAEVYLVGQQLEEIACCTALIPNNLTAATVARAAASLATINLDDTKGTVTFEFRFATTIAPPLPRGVMSSFFAVATLGRPYTYDGVNNPVIGSDFVDDLWHDCEVGWNTSGNLLYIKADDQMTATAYDGSLHNTTPLTIVPYWPCYIRNLKINRN